MCRSELTTNQPTVDKYKQDGLQFDYPNSETRKKAQLRLKFNTNSFTIDKVSCQWKSYWSAIGAAIFKGQSQVNPD